MGAHTQTHFIYWNLIFYYKSIWKLARSGLKKKRKREHRPVQIMEKWIHTASKCYWRHGSWIFWRSFFPVTKWMLVLALSKFNQMPDENWIVPCNLRMLELKHFRRLVWYERPIAWSQYQTLAFPLQHISLSNFSMFENHVPHWMASPVRMLLNGMG